MGSYGFTIDMKRVGDGDAVALWYAMKDRLVKTIWNETRRFNGFKAYLDDESFHTNMSDCRDDSESSMMFAFWEQDVDGVIVDYAIHVAIDSLARYPGSVQSIAAASGFELDLSRFTIDAVTRDRFANHGNNICRVVPWKRGQPVDERPAFVACTHRVVELTAGEVTRLRASAMSGLCACPRCRSRNQFYRRQQLAEAWAALDADATGVRLLDDDPSVLADWFEQHGIALKPMHLAGLATTYKAAAGETA